jgi:hypothetical protein
MTTTTHGSIESKFQPPPKKNTGGLGPFNQGHPLCPIPVQSTLSKCGPPFITGALAPAGAK